MASTYEKKSDRLNKSGLWPSLAFLGTILGTDPSRDTVGELVGPEGNLLGATGLLSYAQSSAFTL